MKYFLVVFFMLCALAADAQRPRRGGSRPPITVQSDENTTQNPQQNRGNNRTAAPARDTIGFERRNDLKDSISITYRFLDSTRRVNIDSSVNDFDRYFPIPSTYQHLGNNGAAAFSLIFQPNLQPGWDPGFHAFDIYRFTLEETKIYRTTRPFSSLSYQLASGKEQMIKAMHTQNPKPNINFGFDYRLITAPGLFITQNTNHNNYRLFGNYQGKRKRYAATVIMLGNTLRASQNGGIVADSFLSDPNRKDRFSVPVNLGNAAQFQSNPFVTTVLTGNTYKEFNFLIRQSYDVGKKDSININDSTTEYLFYPKLRFQHTFNASKRTFRFQDIYADSSVYKNWYDINLVTATDSISFSEQWQQYSNDLSLVQFPDTKNLSQFLSAGITFQNLTATTTKGIYNFYNLIAHGEYRNRTRNKLWDIELKGEFYANGLNSGDYLVNAKLSRFLNKKLGNVILYFHNVNRTPSFIFDNRSTFNFRANNSFNKENITSFGATSASSWATLGFRNTLITNHSYFTDHYRSAQYSKVINILQFTGATHIPFTKRIHWYIDAAVQQTDGAAPIRVPLFFTRNRIAFEGRFFKNLALSTGLEARYYTPFKAGNYSPVLGQYFPQDSVTIKNLPDIAAFFHFRIKTFTGYIRAENLNTVNFTDGFSFTNNNFAAPNYPTPGMIIRFGIQWWFVN